MQAFGFPARCSGAADQCPKNLPDRENIRIRPLTVARIQLYFSIPAGGPVRRYLAIRRSLRMEVLL
jgi:hypothetical protein